MIIIDFSSISIATIFAQPKESLNEDLIRHFILNSLRMYNTKFREEYGKTIIACDHRSWRKKVYPEYKASRKTGRDNSDMDWNFIFDIIGKVQTEIEEFLPYPVIHVKDAEADDIIATLVENTQQFGQYEDVMIVSSDKDFIQLQKYNNVKQFSPAAKKLLYDSSPEKYLFTHVLRGDSSDGVPNVLSADDCFVTKTRQTPLSKKKIENWWTEVKENKKELRDVLDEKTYRNYLRNSTMIDLGKIPRPLTQKINDIYNNVEQKGNSKVLNYLIQKQCKQLISCAEEFFIKK